MKIVFPLIILLLVSCSQNEQCTKKSDCPLPTDYAIQSNCPFATACLDSKCKVACPLASHDKNPQVNQSGIVKCEGDSDCDCSERGQRTIECSCVDNACVSVEG